jgi:hypothetical protein
MTSTARTVYLPADPSQYLTELAWPQKGPNDVVDCTLDATLFLADESLSGGTDTIATVGALTLSGNITGTLTGQTPTTITWTFAGGTVTAPPTVYTIGISFTTAAGNSVSRNIYMTIVPLTLYQGNPQDIAVVQGLPGPPGQQGIPGNVSASAVVYPTHASAGNTPNDMQSLTVEQVFTNVGIEQPLTWYENNAATSTVGTFLSASSVPVGYVSPVINPSAVINSALAYGVPFRLPNTKIGGLTAALVAPATVPFAMRGGANTRLEFTASVGNDGGAGTGMILDANGGNVPVSNGNIIEDVIFQFRHVRMNEQTGAIVPESAPFHFRYVNAGDWTGLTTVATCSTDPLHPSSKGDTFITLPTAAFASLAAAQVLVGTYPQQPFLMPYDYGLQVSTVTQMAGGMPYVVNLVPTQGGGSGTDGPNINHWMGFACINRMTIANSNTLSLLDSDIVYIEPGTTCTFSGSPVGLTVTGISQNNVFLSANVSLEDGVTLEFGTGTSVTFLNGPAVFYSGNGINLNGNQNTYRRVWVLGLSHGCAMRTWGLNHLSLDCGSGDPITTSGCGGWRCTGSGIVDVHRGRSGDEYLALTGSAGADFVISNIEITSNGPPFDVGMNVANPKQNSAYPCSTSQVTNPGNVLLMDLALFPLDNPHWSRSSVSAAAAGFQAQVNAYNAGDPTQQITVLCKSAHATTIYVGAVPNATSGSYNPQLISAGAIVIGVAINGSSVAITLAAIPGQANPVSTQIAANSGLSVNMAYGLDAMTGDVNIRMNNIKARSISNGALNILNRDSPYTMLVTIANFFFDTSANQNDTTQNGWAVGSTPSSGGVEFRLLNGVMKGAYAIPYQFFGTTNWFSADNVDFLAPAVSGTPCITPTGIMAGEISRCRIYSYGADCLDIGAPDSFDTVNNALRGSVGGVSPIVLRNNLYFVSDGFWAVKPQYTGHGVVVDGGAVVPINPSPTANTANGVYFDASAINQVNVSVDRLDCSAIGTAGLAIGTGGPASLNVGYGCSGCTVGEHNISPLSQSALIVPVVQPRVGVAVTAGFPTPAQLQHSANIITSAPAGSSVQLWPQYAAQKITNLTSNAVLVKPPSSGVAINALSPGANYSLAAGASWDFLPVSATEIYTT